MVNYARARHAKVHAILSVGSKVVKSTNTRTDGQTCRYVLTYNIFNFIILTV